MSSPSDSVAETQQGLYGPYTLSEHVIQKIWHTGDFSRQNLCLSDGRTLELLTPGRWNHGDGPDFRGARMIVNGQLWVGDVEVHFHAMDWLEHGHRVDPAYSNVVLHVVLFPLDPDEPLQMKKAGHPLPTLVLLPLLHRDLEEYASDEALEVLTDRKVWSEYEPLRGRPVNDLRVLLFEHETVRWKLKCRFARLRLDKLGWESTAHHLALEILGYGRNRAGMLAAASRYPLEEWEKGVVPENIFEELRDYWVLAGVRPANHPLTRLRQYQKWVRRRPEWPNHLGGLCSEMYELTVAPGESTRLVRSRDDLDGWRERIAEEIVGGAVSGPRLDNLVCDGIIPLWAAAHGGGLSGFWHHWFLGDAPDQLRAALPRLGLAGPGLEPACHGVGQGLLGWILESQGRASGW